jgi:hypothetical protein
LADVFDKRPKNGNDLMGSGTDIGRRSTDFRFRRIAKIRGDRPWGWKSDIRLMGGSGRTRRFGGLDAFSNLSAAFARERRACSHYRKIMVWKGTLCVPG